MSTSVSSVVSHFPSAENGFTTTTSGSVSSGATTVGLNSVAGYSNGEIAVFVIDPSNASKQTFTGVIDTAGVQVTSVVWTAGSNTTHAAGATVVDYATATHVSMISKGLLVEHNQSGTHSNVTATSVTATTGTFTNLTVTGTSVTAGWSALGDVPDTVTANGNRSYDLVFNSNDLTDTVSPGMRLQLTRTVTAPTQCADLELSSSQYFNKTSPAGTTFTDDFCVGVWMKIESLPLVDMKFLSRWNGTSGWDARITSTGQVAVYGYNAGAGNYSGVQSYQAIPIGKWVHVAVQLDMSAFTATTTTSYIMIDGLDVPAFVGRAGTNPTALVQAGNLEIGGANGGLLPFDGKLAQVWYSSAKITQANIRTLMSQGLTASLISTHSIVSAYSLSNSITDLNTTNANNLTAQNSAVATSTDSPFAGGNVSEFTDGTTEMAIVTKTAFSTNTTLTVQVPEGYAIPTSGGVSAVLYSTHKIPYGFPVQKSKWELVTILGTSQTGTAAAGAYVNPGSFGITLTIGEWDLHALLSAQQSNSSAGLYAPRVAMSTSTSDPTDYELVTSMVQRTSSTSASIDIVHLYKPLSITSSTPYYAIISPEAGAGTITVGFASTFSADDEYMTLVRAEFNLL